MSYSGIPDRLMDWSPHTVMPFELTDADEVASSARGVSGPREIGCLQ
jgi:hypothetical protein